MEALNLTVFASIVLAVSAVVFFAWNVGRRSHEHTEHLALLPLDDDAPPASSSHDSAAQPRAADQEKGNSACS